MVNWMGTLSSFNAVRFGVRQGSILGPILFLILMADLPLALNLCEKYSVGYADDVAIWASHQDPLMVQEHLTKHAANFAKFAANQGLVLNAGKTQLMWAGGKSKTKLVVEVDGVEVEPSDTIELLGVRVDCKLSMEIQHTALVRSVKSRASMVARLANHLPRGKYLSQLARGLVLGKAGYAIAAVATPRREGNTSTPSAVGREIQVALNDVARSITGKRRQDHINIADLLSMAGMPSFNFMSVYALAMETWKAFISEDGIDGSRNPLGLLLFPPSGALVNLARSSRSASAGEIPLPLRSAADTMVWHAADLWNSAKALRDAKTKSEASKVAKELARRAPL